MRDRGIEQGEVSYIVTDRNKQRWNEGTNRYGRTLGPERKGLAGLKGWGQAEEEERKQQIGRWNEMESRKLPTVWCPCRRRGIR